MTGFVADASIVASWLLPDEAFDEGLLARALDQGIEVPFIWPAEMANILLTAERRQRLAPEERRTAVSMIGRLDIRQDMQGSPTVWSTTYDLALKNRLSLYDALYLELAIRQTLPLATADSRLAEAAVAEGVAVLGPAAT